MKKSNFSLSTLLKGLFLPVLAAVFLFCFATAVNSLSAGRQDETQQQLEAALRRACVACYATEGIYPPNLAYLKEHYGIQIDEDNYVGRYDIFAENLMPDITVLTNY